MLKTKVKASSVTNLTDARYFAAREVEWLGFQLEEGRENSIDLVTAAAIKEWVDGVQIVGEFGFNQAEQVLPVAEKLGLDAVQLGMFVPEFEFEQLEDYTRIKEVVVQENEEDGSVDTMKLSRLLSNFSDCCEYFLLRFGKPGWNWASLQNSTPFSLEFLQKTCAQYPIILDLECSHEEVEAVLSTLNPAGLNLTGDEEEKVGFKSFDELDEILDRLEVEE